MDLIGNLPRDVAINILSRLPIPTIIECKAVCRAWRNLIKRREFRDGNQQRHLLVFPQTSIFPTSKPDLSPRPYKIEELNKKSMGMSIVHMGLVESVPLVRSSVDGLILLLRREWEEERQRVVLWVCNPITREYVEIPNPSERDFELGLPYPPLIKLPPRRSCGLRAVYRAPPREDGYYDLTRVRGAPPLEYGNYNFGFGVSKSKQYKVVWIAQSECRIYTLGTRGQWRTVPVSGPGLLRFNKWNTECVSLGGNLYWIDPPESPTQAEISCFDLETEAFTYFSAPPTRRDLLPNCFRSLCRFEERLCLCDVYGREIEIWFMQQHGVWSKKLAMNEHVVGGNMFGRLHRFPIKVLEDDNGNVNEMLLGTRIYDTIEYYSNNSNGGTTIIDLYPFEFSYNRYDYPRAAVYTPSFHPLKTLLMDVGEDFRSF